MKRVDEYMGRRFESTDGTLPDVTLVGGDFKAKTVRLHGADGSRQTMPMSLFVRALKRGALVESERRGFVHQGGEFSMVEQDTSKLPTNRIGKGAK